MKTIKILTLGALAASMSFAADAPSVTPVDQCRLALDNAKTNLPSNAYAAKLTLAEGYGTLNALETIYADDKNSKLIPTFLENCQKYAEIAKLQGETQAIQNHIAENWEKRAATNRTIEAIQEQIGEARSGKVSDLEAEKQALTEALNTESDYQKLQQMGNRLKEIKDLLDEKELRWLELDEIGG